MPSARSPLLRHAIALALWVGAGLVAASQSGSLTQPLFVILWPVSLPLTIAWCVVGIHSVVGGLIEARKMRSWPIGLAFVLLLVLSWLGTAVGVRANWEHPSDAHMQEEFREHRREFEELLALYQADRQLGRIAPDFTRPANFFSGDSLPPGDPPGASRIADIRSRCRNLRLEAGLEGYDDKQEVMFIRSTRGLAVSGSSKGFLWAKTRPQPLVENTDRYRPTERRSYWVCRPIEGNWYVYYECAY